jgi:hypothetical protein
MINNLLEKYNVTNSNMTQKHSNMTKSKNICTNETDKNLFVHINKIYKYKNSYHDETNELFVFY